MFDQLATRRYRPFAEGASRHVSVARERAATYAMGGAPTAAEAMAAAESAITMLAAVDWTHEDNDSVRSASVAMQQLVNQVSAQALRPVEQLDRRQAYEHDGAVTAASWLRNRVHMDPAVAARTCTAARRLRRLPLLREAFSSGDVSLAHVAAITEAAVPTRYEAISLVEEFLVNLAKTAKPHSVRVALRAVRDHADPDGSQPQPDDGPCDADEHDPRRYWHQYPTIDGMVEGRYLVDGVTGEMITTLIDAFSTPDPAELPLTSRRSPAQRRADAIRAAVKTLLDAGLAPTAQGNKAHLLLMVDLLTFMNRRDAATFATELRRHGQISTASAARLAPDAKITPVLTMGGYRVVAVGRTFRTLPPWLRPMLEMIHRQCRGPDCDRPATWTQAHHQHDYATGGNTDLNQTIPLCKAHHNLCTHAGWTVTLDTQTGICTWTAPNGRTITTHPAR